MTTTTTPRPPLVVPTTSLEATRTGLKTATRETFIAESADRSRDPYRIGISALGRCRRRNAYALARKPVSDIPPPREGRAANLGTWEHEGFLRRMAELTGGIAEAKVEVKIAGLTFKGSIDLLLPRLPVDLKTVGEHGLTPVRRTMDVKEEFLYQEGGYGLGLLQAGEPPTSLAWIVMDRANGQDEAVVKPFTNEIALKVIDRVEELQEWAENPDEAPRDEWGPGLSFACDECPWLRQCWGEDAVPGDIRAVTARTDPEVQAALAEYDRGRTMESEGKKIKERAMARVEHARYGQYGPWRYGRQKETDMIDEREMVRILTRLGIPIPKKPKRGNVVIKLTEPAVPNGRKE